MTFRIRTLRVRAHTERAVYGIHLKFDDGLTVIRGRNTRGKSTCLMSMLYCLGLEGMISAKRDVPLPHALTEYLEDSDVEIPVQQSDVSLEVENGAGKTVTIQRQIKGPADSRLIRTWPSGVITHDGDALASTDFFVRDPGAATHDAGFHKFLAEFLGWTLPKVTRFDGSETLLYLECIFPLLFIEQKRGWLGLQARMPTYLGIREMQPRALEFLLALDVGSGIRERARLDAAYKQREAAWLDTRATVAAIAHHANGSVHDLPAVPAEPWPEGDPKLLLPEGQGWVALTSRIEETASTLRHLEESEVRRVGPNTDRLTSELKSTENELVDLDAMASSFEAELEMAGIEHASAESRLASLRRDLQRNQDTEKLRRFGSLAQLNLVRNRCPTCHQSIPEKLDYQVTAPIMTLEENIDFIKEMISTVEVVHRDAGRRRDIYARQISALDERRAELRGRIRRLKRSLVQDERAPALADIEERVALEQRLQNLRAVYGRFRDAIARLKVLHRDIEKIRTELAAARNSSLSSDDEDKLNAMQRSFVNQLESYGLASLQNIRISIDRNTYRPKADGMPDLEFELSGSDLIRAIWAYYLALLETGRRNDTNHPGLLIIDEPKQQGTSDATLASMLRRAAQSAASKQQVIVASSADSKTLHRMLRDTPFTELSLDGWGLQRLDVPRKREQDEDSP